MSVTPPLEWWERAGLDTFHHRSYDPLGAVCLRHPGTGEWWLQPLGAPPAFRCRGDHPLHARPYDVDAEWNYDWDGPSYSHSERDGGCGHSHSGSCPLDYQPRHRACPLHPKVGVPGVWSPAGYTACAPDCWTREHDRCPSLDQHDPGWDVNQGEGRWCPDCRDVVETCCDDHCLDCGADT